MVRAAPHFDEPIYAQFVAGCLKDGDREQFESHLYSGCHECQKKVSWYLGLSKAMVRRVAFAAPDTEVEAEGDASSSKGQKALSHRRLSAQAVYDSSLDAPPTGIRGGDMQERQVWYRVGNLDLDLKIERWNDENENVIIGQIIAGDGAGDPAASCFKVFLKDDEGIVRSSYSNELGEFIFHVVPKKSYALEMALSDDTRVFIRNVLSMN